MLTATKRYKALIADGSFIMRSTLRQILSADKNICEIDEAENGTEALNMIKAKEYDVILLDIDMPVMNGIEFLKRSKIYTNAKIIMTSALSHQSINVEKAVFFGAFDVVEKPRTILDDSPAPLRDYKIRDVIDRSFAA